MDALRIVVAFFMSSFFAIVATAPLKRYDQRQDGDLNIQAHLDKIVLLVIPNKNINILDIKGQGQFDNYEDILPLLGKESAAVNEVKFKLATDDSKIKSIVVPEVKDDHKEVPQLKIESKIAAAVAEQKEFKKNSEVRDSAPKKGEPSETKIVSETQKKSAAKSSDGRTYQTLHLSNNRERVVALSEGDAKRPDSTVTKVEKL